MSIYSYKYSQWVMAVCNCLDRQLKTLTNNHPQRETYPCISTQLNHEVNIDEYAQNGQKRQKRNL